MNAAQISTIAAILLSLAFSYIPGIQKKFEPLDGTQKRLIMLVLIVITSSVSFGLSCWPLFKDLVPIVCSQTGALALITSFVQAVIANQATFLISPKPDPVPIPSQTGEQHTYPLR